MRGHPTAPFESTAGIVRQRGAAVASAGALLVLLLLLLIPTAASAQSPAGYHFSTSFGQGVLTKPYGLGVDQSSGDVYIADNSSDRVFKFSSSGALLSGFGSGGSIDGSTAPKGPFEHPATVAVDNSGGASAHDLYVVDPFHDVVDKFSSSGGYICQITGAGSATTSPSECDPTDPAPKGSAPFNIPAGLAVDGAGNVYVSERVNSNVDVFNSKGKYLRSFYVEPEEEDGDPTGPDSTNAVDAAGNLYTATATEEHLGGGVHVYTPAGAPNTTIGCPSVETEGCPRVYESSFTGELRGPGALRGPTGNPFSVAVDPNGGDVVVGDNTGEHSGSTITGPGLIDLYDSAGHQVERFGEEVTPRMGSILFGIGVRSATHDVYVTDYERGIVDVFAPIPSGCTDSWTNTAGGSWFTAANWSKGAVPGPSDNACITASGTYTVTMTQTSATGTVSVNSLTVGGTPGTQTLAVAGTCSKNAILAAHSGISNGWQGAITMTNGETCANSVTLTGPVVNAGKLEVEDPHGGVRAIQGNLTNSGTVSLAAGETLQVSQSYAQASKGKLRTFIAGASSFGSLSVANYATLAGTLVTRQTPPFKGSLGQTFAIVKSVSSRLTGKLATEAEDQINYSGLYYKPTYSAAAVTLVVSRATMSLSAKSGLPGSSVTVSGNGYLPGDTITPAFTDHEGVKTVLPGATTNAKGEYSAKVTIPAFAAVGTGTIVMTSAQTGVQISLEYTVT